MSLIRIQECSKQADIFCAKVSFDQGSAYEVTVRDPFSKEEEERLGWYFEEHLKNPFTDKVKAQEAATSVITYGEKLFAQVFASEPQIHSAYRTVAQAGLVATQIEIIGQPSFHMLHWETLKDPEYSLPLALQATIIRRNLSHPTVYASMHPSPTINLLVVTARPRGMQDVGYRVISRPLVESLRQDKLPVKIDILRPGTYKALEDHLRAMTGQYGVGYYHVVHFDVHGAVLPYPQIRYLLHKRYGRDKLQPYKGMKAFLFLEGEKDNTADPLEATELVNLLIAHQIPVAILNACQSGKQVGESETSLASHLIQTGMQMVLAMGYSVTVTAAEMMMKALYQQLLAESDLSIAIRAARKELYNRKKRQAYFNQLIDLEDWLLPVVYQNQPQRLTTRAFTAEEKAVFYGKRAANYKPAQPLYGFVGRDVDILQIEKRLLTQHNLLLIRGMGGAGKTTLLQHLAAWWQTTGFVEQVFVFEYDKKAWTCQEIMDSIARKLLSPVQYTVFQSHPLDVQEAQLAQILRSQHHLLILDNLESITGANLAILHTLSPEEQKALHDLLIDLAGGHTLVLLGSRGGEDWLAPSTFADNIYELAGLDPEAASTLADRILERYQVTKYRTEENLQKLLTLLNGFPLALEIVLANLAHQAPLEVLAALQAGDMSLDNKADAQEKTKSIVRCIDYSYSNLSPDAQTLLACLTPFTSVIWQDTLDKYSSHLKQQPALASLPFDRWPALIQQATNWGLLSPDPAIPTFLHMQPVLSYFLHNRLQGAKHQLTLKAIQTAFREHYDEEGEVLYQLLKSKDPEERLGGLLLVRLEYENLHTALNLALEAQVSIRNPYNALSSYLEDMQDQHRGLALGKTVLSHLQTYPAEKLVGQLGFEIVSVIDNIASRQLALKEYALAEISCQQALSLWQKNTSFTADHIKLSSAAIYHKLGRVAQEQRKWEQAEGYYQQALQVFVEFNDRHSEARRSQAMTYHNLGAIAQEQRKWEQAEGYYQQALQLFIESNDRFLQAGVYHQLALGAEGQRKWEQAKQYYYQALQLYFEFNDRYSQAKTYRNLGRVAQEQHKWEQAKHYYQQALQLFIEFNARYEQADTYHKLGMVAQEQREWEQAKRYYQQTLQLYLEYNDRFWQAGTYHQLGTVARHQREWEQAEGYYQQALQLYIEFNNRYEQAGTYGQLGNLAREQQEWEQAKRYYQQALQLFIEFNNSFEQAGTYYYLGMVAQEQREREQAKRYYQQALQLFIDSHDHSNEANVYGQLGMLAEEEQQWEEARNYLLKALEIFVAHNNIDSGRTAVRSLARVWKANGDVSIPGRVSGIVGGSVEEVVGAFREVVENDFDELNN